MVSNQRTVLLRCLAITSGVTAVIHFAVSGEHFTEYWAFGVFMLAVAWLQLAWSAGLLIRPSRRLLLLGAALNTGVVAVYVVTRTVGDVIGPSPHDVEPVGFGDAFCTAGEALIVIGSVLLLLRPFDRAVSRTASTAMPASAAALAVVLLSVSLLDGGPEMVMSMDDDASTATVSLATTAPAGPVTVPDPHAQMAAGMKMAGDACTDAPTAAQESAAVRLVDATWADAKKYQSLAAAKAAGFRPVTPTGRPVVHYIDAANYRTTRRGGPILNPSAPQSLVYANTPKGAVLAAVMYIAGPRTGTPPDPGGCLTQWHVHTNLCFGHASGHGGAGVVGLADPTCPAGSRNRVSPPMLHIWLAPIPGGPTAVDAPDAQVVKAAEHVSGPGNGRA